MTLLLLLHIILLMFMPFSVQLEFTRFSLFHRFPLQQHNKLFIHDTAEWTFKLSPVLELQRALQYTFLHMSPDHLEKKFSTTSYLR